MAYKRVKVPVLLRLQNRTVYDPSGCWLWDGATNGGAKKGGKDYGIIVDEDGKLRGVHVVSFFLHHPELDGQFPEGTSHVHHTCETPLCWNPEHLEAKSPRDNVMASDTIVARHAAKTHCDYGHPLSGDNLRIVQWGGRNPTRQCNACIKRRSLARSKKRV